MIARRSGEVTAKILETVKSTTVIDVNGTTRKMRKYLDGTAWEVEYFSALKAQNDGLLNLDEGVPISENGYMRLNGLTILLSAPISTTTVDELVGSATMTVAVAPQVGDMFIATLITGDVAIFRVTDVKTVTYSLDAIYEFDFKIDTLEAVDPDRFIALRRAVVKEYTYVKDTNGIQGGTLLISDDMAVVKKIDAMTNVFSNGFFMEYVHKGYVAYEKDGDIIHCPEVHALMNQMGTILPSKLNNPFDISSKYFMAYLETMMPYRDTWFNWIRVEDLPKLGNMHMRMRGSSNVDVITTFSDEYVDCDKSPIVVNENLPSYEKIEYDEEGELITKEGMGIFPLNKTSGDRPLVVLMNDYFENKPLNKELLISVVDSYNTWGYEEKYYYTGVLLLLMRYTRISLTK